MLDYRELGFDSEEELLKQVESERDYELSVWNALQVWKD